MQKCVLVALACLSGVMLLVTPQAAFAKKMECNGAVIGQNINGGLVVNVGDTCSVTQSEVNGGIEVNGGSLTVCSSIINGGVTGTIEGGDVANVGGFVSIGETDTASCPGDFVNGGVRLSGIGISEIDSSTVNGSVFLTTLIPGYNGGEVEGSIINGGLSCGPGFYNDTSLSNVVNGPVNCTLATSVP